MSRTASDRRHPETEPTPIVADPETLSATTPDDQAPQDPESAQAVQTERPRAGATGAIPITAEGEPKPVTTARTPTGSLRTLTGALPTITGAMPTLTGGVPVLEDLADQDTAVRGEAPRTDGRTRVTALVITVLTLLSAIGPLATDMYVPAFPDVTEGLGTTAARLQLTLTAFFMGSAAGQIVAGPMSDRMGRRGPLIFGTAMCLLASVGCALAPNVTVLLVLRVLQGFGGGFGQVLGRAVVIDLTDGPEMFRVMNIMQGVGGIAPIVAPLLGGFIMIFGQWRDVFWVIVAMSLVSLLGALFLIPETLDPSRRRGGGFTTLLRNCRTLLARPNFVGYLLVNAFSALCLMAYVSASSFVVQSMLGFTSSQYSMIFAANSLGMMCMSLLSARLGQTHDPRRLIAIGLSISSTAAVALLLGTLFLGSPIWIILPGFFLTVAAQGLIFGNGGAMASQEATEYAGTGSALLGLGFSFASSAAAPLVGLAGTHSSLPMAIVMVCGAAASAACLDAVGRTGRGSGSDAREPVPAA